MQLSLSLVPTDLVIQYCNIIKIMNNMRENNLVQYSKLDEVRTKVHCQIKLYKLDNDANFDFELANIVESFLM